eukprot:jgi/Phyca11/17680/fgenesh1_pg.PHYCAscaffold_29_\
MADDADWLPDLAALASLSVAVHYVLGLYGLLGALLIFILVEHGASLRVKSERTPSTNEDDASTEGDEELSAPSDDQELLDQQEEEEETQHRQRLARQRMANLVVSDVGSITPTRQDFEMNSRTPVPFETELFAGHALFLVRTQPEDPHYAALFEGKRRMFWIQVQGRFKQAPSGPVYLGGELPARIAPGVFTRSVAMVIMGLIRRLGRVSFSFGSSTDSENLDELPAVAFPLYQSVDQFVETPEGEIPPGLGTADFGESDEQRRKRRQTPLGDEKYAVGPTYTFDFHTMYVDLTRWETANLPGGLNAMDLAGFFDSLPLRLVAYEVKPSAVELSDSHRQRDKDYLFSFEVKYDKNKRHPHNDYEVMVNEEAMREAGERDGRGSSVSGTGVGEYDDTVLDTDGELVKPQCRYRLAIAELYKCLTKRQRLQEPYSASTKLSPSRIGVNLSRRDREDMGVVFEGVIYRYYAAELLRQEVLLLTKDTLMFYRSYDSSPEKQVPCSHIIGARAVEVPSTAAFHDGASGTDGAFALQISTFAEEIVLCVGTSSTRDAWLRQTGYLSGDTTGTDTVMIAADTVAGSLKLVKRTLTRALHILNNAQHLSVTDVLAFLDDASALREVDLKLLQDSGSHEEQVSFYLNLYHTVLAHAMISQGFPRGKESLHDQLNAVLRALLKRSSAQGYLEVNEDSNTIVLPRLLGFMDSELQMQVINALGVDDAPLRTKFRSFKAGDGSGAMDSTETEESGGKTQL